jgi:hypothetical protein
MNCTHELMLVKIKISDKELLAATTQQNRIDKWRGTELFIQRAGIKPHQLDNQTDILVPSQAR